MPLLITEMELDTAKLLSLVDAGASGDEENRPSIVLFKRSKEKMETLNDEQRIEVAKIMKQVALAKMGVAQVVTALDELGLKPEQRDGVLKLMEAMMGTPEEPKQEAPMPEEKAEEPPMPEEDKEMSKRAEELKTELAKRDERIKKLEAEALNVRIAKRADELKFIPGLDSEELLDLCKRADGDEKFNAVLDKVAKASKESPLFKEYGITVANGGDGSATATLEKRAKVLMDADPTLTTAKARTMVLRNDQDLYRRINAEARA